LRELKRRALRVAADETDRTRVLFTDAFAGNLAAESSCDLLPRTLLEATVAPPALFAVSGLATDFATGVKGATTAVASGVGASTLRGKTAGAG